jgi:hypothetical protein
MPRVKGGGETLDQFNVIGRLRKTSGAKAGFFSSFTAGLKACSTP